MQKKRVFGAMTAAGCALFAASAMGAASTVLSEGFESPATTPAAVTTLSNWDGYGTVTASNYTSTVDSTVGRPIGAGSNVLVVEGRVTRSAIGTSLAKPATVEMMVQIALPDDALAFPSGTDTADIQIAVGVETNATLKIWCKNKEGTTGWYGLGSTAYAVGSWHRVSFTFDYANSNEKICQVRVDGDPILTENGYLTANILDHNGKDGSWYKLAKSNATSLSSVQVIGSTAIDDLLVKDDASAESADSVLPTLADASGDTNGVSNDWIEKQGITRAMASGDALDNSGMTVAQKYKTGLSVDDGVVFAITDMTMSGSTATLTVPTATAASGYVNKIQYSTDKEHWEDANVTASGTVSVSVNPGNAGTPPAVIYVRLVNKAAN